MAAGSLFPTWRGHVATTRDALILFEASLNGTLHHVPRRPHDRERNTLIQSGSVFIYEENASGIKRWTDGVPWSPSRILGNFLIYRELMKPFPPGEKKRATKRNKRLSKPGEPYPRPNDPESPVAKSDGGVDGRESERALIGSLVDSYGFKDGGLVKKTMSVNVHGVHHHLVSYYRVSDVLEGTLINASKDPCFHNIEPRPELSQRQNFRAPLDESEDCMPDGMDGSHAAFAYDHGYDPRRQQMSILQANHGHHTSSLSMPLYVNPATPYSSAPHLQQSMNTYAPTTTTYHTNSYPTATHTLSPRQDEYTSYQYASGQGHAVGDSRQAAPPPTPSSYTYRSPTDALISRPSMMPSPSPSHDMKPLIDTNVAWTQARTAGGPGVYAPTAPVQQGQGTQQQASQSQRSQPSPLTGTSNGVSAAYTNGHHSGPSPPQLHHQLPVSQSLQQQRSVHPHSHQQWSMSSAQSVQTLPRLEHWNGAGHGAENWLQSHLQARTGQYAARGST